MSDREGPSGGANDDDLSLPKATVAKMISGMFGLTHSFGTHLSELLPNDVTCAKETRDLVIECCVDRLQEFIHLISSEANEICEQESKKTIAPEHIISALKRLGFDSFTREVEDVLKEHKQQQKDREKKVSKLEQSGLSPEELQAKQEELFAASRAKFQSNTTAPT
ncbi:Negative cofactor 2 complex subunit beta [Mycena indigotica]|uniref:Negative cofactor 2 complex subunit beta n=1 Tax=Mycena indigotica TaxID=2126181 RepID=A0A8H6SNE1_9AGAR|nr:Negative cofactor 2 complex subunit beta [Mycena indigotica]KAF7301437.1 Negative cofactor 2 complex subunit beta [Mycena indigotica]